MVTNKSGVHLLPRIVNWERGNQAAILREFCIGLGITPICFHDLRATFITQMFANGANIAEVQSIVGHSQLKTTQVYLRLAGVNIKGATEKLNFIDPISSNLENVVDIKTKMERFGT